MNYTAGGNFADHFNKLHDILHPREAAVIPMVEVLFFLHMFKRGGCTIKRRGKLSIFDITGHQRIECVYVSGFLPKDSAYILDLNAIDRQTQAAIYHFNNR